MEKRIHKYLNTLHQLLTETEASFKTEEAALETVLDGLIEELKKAKQEGRRLFFMGNGGSTGIASHMTTDYLKNGRFRTISLTEASTLTCLSNDYGYEEVYAKQLELLLEDRDIIFAISSSGASENILRAIEEARKRNCVIITLSGFSADNPLRAQGDFNLYINSDVYGFVEVAHQTLLHAILDMAMGWK